MAQKILFLRNANLFADETAAKAALDALVHVPGQPVIALYGTVEDTRMIFCIGKVAAAGATAYETMSSGTKLDQLEAALNTRIDTFEDALDLKANLNSPAFTGTPTVPTPQADAEVGQVANVEFVTSEINAKIAAAEAMRYQGTIGTGGTVTELPAEPKIGDTYVAIAGCPDVNGEKIEPRDMIICQAAAVVDPATSAVWTVIQGNVDGVVIGPESSVDSEIAVFSGTTGKLIKNSGVLTSSLVSNSRSVMAGAGLTGGGDLTDNRTISHGVKPTEGTDAGGTGTFVTSVSIDEFGHVVSSTKTNLTVVSEPGTGDAGAGFVTGIQINGKDITLLKSPAPTVSESGKVRVVDGSTSDFLGNLITAETEGLVEGKYAVSVVVDETAANKKLKLSCTVDTIDGGTFGA